MTQNFAFVIFKNILNTKSLFGFGQALPTPSGEK